ncbi:MAG: SpaA isopeptide-forming pilin-related protein [Bacillota bacterium]|nr:SpaA isopeptide-forming pilin-related protein [Bacillota bacterium]
MKTFKRVLSTMLAVVLAFSTMNKSTSMIVYAREAEAEIVTASEEVPAEPVETPQIQQPSESEDGDFENVNDAITDPETSATEQDTEPIEDEIVEEEEEEIEQQNEDTSIPTSSNLTNFAYTISGPDTVKPNQVVEFEVGFREGKSLQFANRDTLVYTLPEGVTGINDNGTFNIVITDSEGTFTISGNTYSISGNSIVVHFNTADSNFEHLTGAPNVEFHIRFNASLGKTATFIGSGGQALKEVTVDTSNSMSVEKQSYYNSSDNKVHYRITVVSNGSNTGVKVADTITGSALSYNNDLTVKKNGENVSYNGGQSGNGFDITIPSMDYNESVVIEYTASVDFTKVSGKTDEATLKQELNNQVKVHSNELPNDIVKESKPQIDVFSIGKYGNAVKNDDGSYTITWTVTYNENKRANVSGSKVTDTITNPELHHYQGSVVVKQDDQEIDNFTPSGNSWEYTIPNTDKASKYTFTYNTQVDASTMESLEYSTQANNKVTSDKGKEAFGSANIDVDYSSIPRLTKSLASKTDEKMIWDIEIIVPAKGLTKAELKDIVPSMNSGSESYSDTITSMRVTEGLLSGENAQVDKTSGTIVFTNDGQPGLKASDSPRTIKVTVETAINQDWVEYAGETGDFKWHTNTAELYYNKSSRAITSDASAEGPGSDALPGVEKTYVSKTDEKVTWQIAISVPKTGLSKAELEDVVPSVYANGQMLKDEIVTMDVVSGLLDGENASYQEDEWGNGKIVFTKDGNPGLKASNSSRQVVISVETEINANWKEYSQTTGQDTVHQNKAILYLKDGNFVEDTAQVEIKGRTTSLTKDGQPASYWDVERGEVKGYKYWISFNNVSGDLVVNEVFDTTLLSMSPGQSYIYGGNQYYQGDGQKAISFTPNATGGQFTMAEEDLPKNQNGELYEFYKIEYFLEATNDEELLKAAAIRNNGQANLGNTVEYDGESAHKDFFWQLDNVSKELINKGEINSKNKVAKYRITINKEAMEMNHGNPMDFVDSYENLSIDYTTIQITDANGNVIDGVTRKYKGNTITFGNIPDGKTIIITYDATVTKNENGVNIVNNIQWKGYSASSSEWVDVQSSGEGAGSNLAIRILKVDKDNNAKTLAGVQFQLFNGDGTPVLGRGQPVIATTDENGVAFLEGKMDRDDWVIWPGDTYYVQEISALPGYQANTTKYYFQVSNTDVDYDQYIYYNNDILTIKNEKEKISIPVEKIWSSEIPTEEQTAVTVKLLRGGQVVGELELSNANQWQASFNNYEKTDDAGNAYVYTVVEDMTGKAFNSKVSGDVENGFTITNSYPGKEVSISKQDIGGQELAGASLVIKNKDSEVVEQWTSDGSVHKVELQPGTYTLTETTAPKGYVKSESITFKVTKDGKVTVGGNEVNAVTMIDAYADQDVVIKKTDIAGNELAGAELSIVDASGQNVISWVSKADETKEVALQPGAYTLIEKKAPLGYDIAESISFTVDKEGVVRVNGQAVEAVVMKDELSNHNVSISKVDIAGNEIKDARLSVSGTSEDGQTITPITWTSNGTTHELSLPAGTYTLTETQAPNGYEIAQSITFVVTKSGKVKVEKEEVDQVVMVDEYSDQTVVISKQDISGKEIEGAQLSVTDSEGNEVDSWTSVKDESHEISVQPGTYTLTENSAPNGYEVSESITFVVDKDGKVTVGNEEVDQVIMVDEYSDQTVVISKQDISGKEIEGAQLKVTDKSGNVVDTWTSEEGQSHEISVQPGTYTLTENTAPNGYEKSESITFVVDKDGKVTVGNEEVDQVVMVDEYSDQTVVISKQDISGNEIAGAQLFVTDNKGNVVDTWTSVEGQSHEISVQPGTYTLTENAAPNGYELAEAITFVVDKEGNVTVGKDKVDAVVMVDKYSDQTVVISKQDISGNEIEGAELTVTDSEGNVVESWTSEEGQSHEISVQPGEYTLTENTAPNGYEVSESITFVVDETGKVTVGGEEVEKVVMVDEYSDQTVVISKQDISGKEIEGAELSVTDKEGNTVDTWTSVEGESHEINVQPGEYTLTENTAPDGYVKSESITFEVDKDGKVTISEQEVDKVVMIDEYADQKVAISKQDIIGNEIAGAELSVTDEDGNEVASWTSEAGKSYRIDLQPGTYTLVENTAPEGYEVSQSITFAVDKDGKVTINEKEVEKVIMTDEYTDHKVKVSKVDVAGNEVEGAQMKITGTTKGGETVEITWESGKEAKEIELQPGEYTLEETMAPNGYEVAESIEFTVGIQGVDKVQEIEMVDEYSDQTVVISKQDISGNEIAGAELSVTDKDGNVVETWTSVKGESHEISVQPGTYQLIEITAPNGYEASESITFVVDKDGNVKVGKDKVDAVVMVDEYADQKVTISKQDVAGNEIAGAELSVTDSEGNVVETWTSEEGKSHKVDLQPGEYTLTENTAPEGYVVSESITFVVDETGTVSVNGQEVSAVVMTDEYENHKVKVSKVDVAGNEVEGAQMKITGTTKGGETVEITWESGKEAKEIELQPGEYTLEETMAPNGYEVAESIEFTVGIQGVEEVQEIEMVDAWSDQTVKISKQDVAGKELAGATLTITGTTEDGQEITPITWESTGNTRNVVLQPGTYTLTEDSAPNGYEVSESITFVVDKDGKVTVGKDKVDAVVMVDEYADQTVVISKQDISGKEIEGAELTVTDSEGNEVDSWTSEKDVSHEISVQPGTYTLTENSAPNGYEVSESITFVVDKDGNVKVGNDKVDKVVMVDEYSDQTVVISKQDISGKEIEGAQLSVTDSEGNEVDAWTSVKGESHEITVQPGEYTLTENTAPNGYEVSESITFIVDKDGKVTVGNEEVDKVVMVDEYSDQTVVISKQDINGNEISGADLKVKDQDGKVIDSWTSREDQTHEITVQPGTYTLVEDLAPLGYEKAESITFSVDHTGKVTVKGVAVDNVVMVDAFSDQRVTISKQDISGKEIEGAQLKVTDKSGNVVDTWTSEEGQSHEISVQPGEYTLEETTAPNGYEVSESITFVVDETGKVTIGGQEVDQVIMVDEYSDHNVVISKQDITGKEISGAQLKVTDNAGNVVETWTSVEGQSHEVSLQPGTYKLVENLAPLGYEKAATITFSVDLSGKVTVGEQEVDQVVMVDEYADQKVIISKQDIVGNEIAGAELSVTDSEGNVVETWTSEEGKSHKVDLQPGEYTLTENTAPEGYVVSESITFVVDETGTVSVNGQEVSAVVMTDEYENHKVKVSKVDVAGNEVEGAQMKITGTTKGGETVEITWESGKEAKEIELQPGEYTLEETMAPNGYEVAESIEFTVGIQGVEEVQEIEMVDAWSDQTVKISKQDVAGKELAGATLTITGTTEDGQEITPITWESTGNTRNVVLQPGTYTLTEDSAPNGYEVSESITFVVDKDGKVTVGKDKVDAVVMVDEYADQTVVISKQDIFGNEIEGAELTVTDKEGNVVESWTSVKDESHEISVQPGEYTLTENTAPNGYEVSESITFVVDETGKVTVGGEEVEKVVMVDEYSDQTVVISKQDISGKEIEGAELSVTDKEGNTVDTWTSVEGESHEINVQPGEYTLTENTAPDGYVKSESITFEVDKDGKVTISEQEVDKVVMIDEYADQKVAISKQDIIGNEIAGAELSVTDEDGNEVASWTSEAGKSYRIDLQPGTYTLVENTAPEGYEVSQSITFAVDKDGKVTINEKEVEKVIMTDEYTDHKVKVSKVDVAGNEVEGAQMKITGTTKGGETVEITWESGKEAKEIELQPGEYTLEETMAPNGYEVAESIDFTVGIQGVEEVQEIEMVDEYSDQTVVISKQDISGNEIAGAELSVTDSEGNVVETWTSVKGESHEISVQPGEYTLTENSAPNGYEVSESITFVVDKDGNVKVGKVKVDAVIMVDEYSDQTVVISKQDISGNEIEGAQLSVTDSEGNTVDTWTSVEGQSHEISVQPGEYTLTENTAPNGYEVSESITFVVDKDGNVKVGKDTVDVVVMVDEYSDQTVVISKQDISGKEIEGAQLSVTDSEGNVVESWTSVEGESHEISVQPGEYTLTENSAPNGYEVSESITFVVDKDGIVKVGNEEVEKVVMIDDYSEQLVTVKKTDFSNREVMGASLTLYDEDGNVVKSWITDAPGKEVEVLPGTYTLVENYAPAGFEIARPVTFTIDHTGKITVDGKTVRGTNVYMLDAWVKHTILVSKQDIAGNELAGAELTIAGHRKDGQEIVPITWTSTGDAKFVQLQPGTYTFTENKAPLGYDIAETVEFTVNELGMIIVDGNAVDELIMIDELSTYDVTISKTDIAGEELADAQLRVNGVTDSGEQVEFTWTTDGKVKEINVKAGTYVLSEISAPDGYEKADPITFVVSKEGIVTIGDDEVDKVVMVDKYADHKVAISKVDITGEEIEGAKLTVTGTSKDGEKVEITWTSEAGKSHELELQPGEYTLTEVTAPDGYEVAESIEFTVDVEGVDEVQNIKMEDKWSDHKVMISKVDFNGKEIEGAELTVTGTTKDGRQVEITWISEAGKSHELELQPGDYTLTEVMAPNGYEIAESIDFTVTVNGVEEVQEIVMKDAWSNHKVIVNKTDMKDLIGGAKLQIIGTTLDGQSYTETWTTVAGQSYVTELQPGVYTLKEISAPKGYAIAKDITFEIDVDGTISVVDKKGNKEVVKEIVMVDKKVNGGTPTSVNTNSTFYGGGMLASMFALLVIMLKKRKETE